MSRVAADGATERDHQESAAKQWAMLGRKPKARPVVGGEAPECPEAFDYLWGWFCEVCHGIDSGGFGAPSITWSCLKAWTELMQQSLEPWEAMTLVRLGALRAQIASEKAESGK